MTIRCNSRFHPNSYPRPPHGGRPTNSKKSSASWQFLSTPSAWRATIDLYVTANANALFLSTPSAWRATTILFSSMSRIINFYPRPPHGGRPFQRLQGLLSKAAFLSTPSAWRATQGRQGVSGRGPISIHALRMEGDSPTPEAYRHHQHFYPRPPHGGRPV